MPEISIQKLAIHRSGTIDPNNPHISKIELEMVFNVDKSRLIAYQIFNAQNVRIQTVRNRFYNKGETLYATIRETSFYDPALMPRKEYGADGQVRLVAWLIDGNNQRISDMATSILNVPRATPEKIQQYEQLVESLKTPSDIITEPTPVTVTEPILPEISILPQVYAEPEVINTQVTTNMIRQELVNFTITNNRIQGSIKFTATNSFNPYYYNKEITNYLQLKSNNKIILIKPNRLRFTETERDEVINFNEYAFNLDSINAESYVWTSADLAMSNTLQFTIETGKETKITNGTAGIFGAGVVGAIGILILLGFVADHVRKRK